MTVLKLLAAAAVAYVATRAAWIFLGWFGVIVVAALFMCAIAAARRGERELSFGLAAGAIVSVIALTL
jgi:Ca2+/H+ antiporter